MSAQKKILIFGLIGDFGGIAVEVNFLAKVLTNTYRVNLLSSHKITADSPAVIKNKNFTWNYIARKIYNENFLIKISSKLTKLINKRNDEAVSFIGNKISHRFFDFEKLHLNIIENSILESDLVMFFGHFESKWLEEVVKFSHLKGKPFIFRTTGTIRIIPPHLVSSFQDNYSILVHSKQNLELLRNNRFSNNLIIDQTSNVEKKLLEIDSKLKKRKLTYGYLGRFGKEKGVLEFLAIMKSLKKPVVLAGDGLLVKDVENFIKNTINVTYLGKLKSNGISNFFERIDVLVIPSFEESGPLVGIEAMAAAKLIISTKVGATMDRLDGTNNQFWFDITNPESLVKTINDLETLPLETLEKIKLQLREKYLSNYSNTSLSVQYKKVLRTYLA